MEATKQLIVPSTRELKALKQDLQPTGTVWRCIQAGFIKGLINTQQATDLQHQLATVVDYCQEQQAIIFNLQAELAKSKQTSLFN
ncbi:hypothetical protein GO755_07715 [Spirosoma sp. HMF4905]|uniref:Uncharacterized protein n=1 Tax=Spirosoma arboris TaxID=2682092 RepID=A0A7K1S800_9BACT|nr:hypothetical protein [Spirosoma arboris]MVM29915.1 hypothetical protein [Spirosoma arboris]